MPLGKQMNSRILGSIKLHTVHTKGEATDNSEQLKSNYQQSLLFRKQVFNFIIFMILELQTNSNSLFDFGKKSR